MAQHLETYNDWLNWDDEEENNVTISPELFKTLTENKLVDAIDAYALSRRIRDTKEES